MWQVILSTRAEKQINRLSVNVKTRLFYLLVEIEQTVPIRENWPNYGKLDETRHHKHFSKTRGYHVIRTRFLPVDTETDGAYEGRGAVTA